MSSPLYIPADDLIGVLGLVNALKLVEKLGGTGLYCPGPDKLHADHALVKALGADGAHKFASEWRRMDVMLPRCEAALRRLRDRALREDAVKLSVRDLALKYDTTERHVYRLLAAAGDAAAEDQDKKQPELFD